jgi:phospholipid/cholesterol/gamma-HCH transport system substrate-binding protein
MIARDSQREVWVGAVLVAAVAGFIGLLALAGGGPGFLARTRSFDVLFRDGQGLREGSAVRIAGIDAGRVTNIDLVEHEGSLRAQVRIAMPTHLYKKLKQDVKVTIQPSLTGTARVNVVASGRSNVALVSGQVVQGVESTFFDPILEQVGIGPVERNHLSHTIAEVRSTLDAAAPKIRMMVANLEATTGIVKDSADVVRPAVEASAKNLEILAQRIAASTPKIESTLTRLESVTAQADGLITENRNDLHATLASIRDLTATAQDMSRRNREKVEKLIDGVELTRARADRVLYQADILAGQSVEIMTRNRANLERTIANTRDATDWADKLVQKLFANPFVLSPFYKPTPEDTRVQTVYDTAQVFTKGAQELNDMVKTLDAMRTRARTPAQAEEIAQLERNIMAVTGKLNETSQLLADGLRRPAAPVRVRRQ